MLSQPWKTNTVIPSLPLWLTQHSPAPKFPFSWGTTRSSPQPPKLGHIWLILFLLRSHPSCLKSFQLYPGNNFLIILFSLPTDWHKQSPPHPLSLGSNIIGFLTFLRSNAASTLPPDSLLEITGHWSLMVFIIWLQSIFWFHLTMFSF